MVVKNSSPSFDLAVIRKRFVKWVEDHPCDGEVFWHVQNCVGNLIDWTERPSTWIDDETLAQCLMNALGPGWHVVRRPVITDSDSEIRDY